MPDVIAIDSEAASKRIDEAEKVPVFSIDGKVYTVAKVERADLGLEYLGRVEEEGAEAAQAWLIRNTVGDEGFQALRGVVGLSPADWDAIQTKIQGMVIPKARTARA